MSRLTADISVSLDGYVAGPNPSLEYPLGEGGEQLHDWAFALESFRAQHGLEGGDRGPVAELVDERLANTGATVMGRRMYSGGEGPWEDDPRASGWWGDDPPFHHPVFVLTHHAREPLAMQGGTTFTFVTDGIESALEQAREAAGGKNVLVAGGGTAIQQYLKVGLLDELDVHIVPVFLGGGAPLFEDHVEGAPPKLERTHVLDTDDGVIHLRYRVLK